MLQSSRAQQPANQNPRLPKQSGVPSYGDLQFVMEKAQKSKTNYVELPYSTPENGCEYLLSIQDRPKEDVTEWRLVLFSPTGDQTLWHYASRDLTLICNLISTSSGSELMQDMMLAGPSSLNPDKTAAAKSQLLTDDTSSPFFAAPPNSNPAQAQASNSAPPPPASWSLGQATNSPPAPAANSFPATAASWSPPPAANSPPPPAANAFPAPAASWSSPPAASAPPAPSTDSFQAPAIDAFPVPTANSFPAPAANSSPAPANNSFPAPAANSSPTPAANSFPAPAANSFPAPAANSFPAPAANSFPAPAANSFPAPATNSFTTPPANPFPAPTISPVISASFANPSAVNPAAVNPAAVNPAASGPSPAALPTPVSNPPTAHIDNGITFEPPQPESKATLQGDLQLVAINNLLQSISQSQLSGRLDVRTRTEKSEVYFADGKAIHCTVKETIGNNALIELISWRSGEYRFWEGERTSLKTVNKDIEALIGQGLAIVDQARYLDNNGLRPESCLVKRSAMITEDELKDRLSKGVPHDLDEQVDFYASIDNRKSLFELLKERPISKSSWVPTLFNLVSMGLVQISDQPLLQNRLSNLRSLGVDENAVQHIGKGLLRSDSGILSFPAFIYLLDQEYLRYEFFNLPFSLVTFSIGQRNNETGQVYALQMLAIRRAMQRISLVKRQVDLLGHYGDHDYALLLPSTNSAAATALAHRIVDVLKEAPLASDVDTRSLALAFGVATVPEDCHEMDKLLIAATKARDLAKTTNRIVVQSREIIGQTPLS